jgi:hypothetical protein
MLKWTIKGLKKAVGGCLGRGEAETLMCPVWIDEEQCLQGESSWSWGGDGYNLDKVGEKIDSESSSQELKVVLSPWSFSSEEMKRMLQRRRQGNGNDETHAGLFQLSERDRKVLCKLYEEDKYKSMTEMERRVLVLQQGLLRYRRTLTKAQRSRIAQEHKFVRNEHSKMLEECWGKYFVDKASRNLQESPPRVEELTDSHAGMDVPLRALFEGQDTHAKTHHATKLSADEYQNRKQQCQNVDVPFLKSGTPCTAMEKLESGQKSFRISAHHADEAIQPKLSFKFVE